VNGEQLYGLYADEIVIATTDEIDSWEALNPVHQTAWNNLAKRIQAESKFLELQQRINIAEFKITDVIECIRLIATPKDERPWDDEDTVEIIEEKLQRRYV
jgi:hypothetical protein